MISAALLVGQPRAFKSVHREKGRDVLVPNRACLARAYAICRCRRSFCRERWHARSGFRRASPDGRWGDYRGCPLQEGRYRRALEAQRPHRNAVHDRGRQGIALHVGDRLALENHQLPHHQVSAWLVLHHAPRPKPVSVTPATPSRPSPGHTYGSNCFLNLHVRRSTERSVLRCHFLLSRSGKVIMAAAPPNATASTSEQRPRFWRPLPSARRGEACQARIP